MFLLSLLDEQNNFMFSTCKNSQKRVKNQKSSDKHSSFDGLIQEDIDLSEIYLAVSMLTLLWEGGDRKCLKMCVRNIWMVPEDVLAISVHVRLMSVADDCGYERPPRLLRL